LQIRTLAFIDFALGLVSFAFQVRKVYLLLFKKIFESNFAFRLRC
jgi:hypothetical protein